MDLWNDTSLEASLAHITIVYLIMGLIFFPLGEYLGLKKENRFNLHLYKKNLIKNEIILIILYIILISILSILSYLYGV